MEDYETLLKGSSKAHGHLCPGQVVGVRMAMLGCRLIGLDEPSTLPQIKKIIVYVEIDRCAADAISYVTGVRLGRRSLKFMDYGIMAATFVNLETGKAFRVVSTEEARDLAAIYAPEITPKAAQQLAAYQKMPDSVLFRVQEIEIDIKEYDLPGPTRKKIACTRCGQVIRDNREIVSGSEILCRLCTAGAYFQSAREITWPDMNIIPDNSGRTSDKIECNCHEKNKY